MCLFQKTNVRNHTTALLFLFPARFIPEVRHLGRSYLSHVGRRTNVKLHTPMSRLVLYSIFTYAKLRQVYPLINSSQLAHEVVGWYE